jgi:hypothetical protein
MVNKAENQLLTMSGFLRGCSKNCSNTWNFHPSTPKPDTARGSRVEGCSSNIGGGRTGSSDPAAPWQSLGSHSAIEVQSLEKDGANIVSGFRVANGPARVHPAHVAGGVPTGRVAIITA